LQARVLSLYRLQLLAQVAQRPLDLRHSRRRRIQMALADWADGTIVSVRPDQANCTQPRALLFGFALVSTGLERKGSGRADFRIHAFELIAQPLTFGAERSEHVLAIAHHGFALNPIIARDALQDRYDGLVCRRDCSFIHQADLFGLVK
jgi:hypothetical protein